MVSFESVKFHILIFQYDRFKRGDHNRIETEFGIIPVEREALPEVFLDFVKNSGCSVYIQGVIRIDLGKAGHTVKQQMSINMIFVIVGDENMFQIF